MKLTRDARTSPLRAAAVAARLTAVGAVRAQLRHQIPAQDMVYLEKAAEARRFLAAYPTLEDDPGDDRPRPGRSASRSSPPRSASPPPTGWEVAQFYVAGAALFRAGRRGDRRHPARHRRAIELAATPAEIDAAEAAATAAFAAIPIPEA